MMARIGPVERFRKAEHLIAFAGLAPGVQQSDQTWRTGRIGGGGTDKHLRHYLIEASVWARHLPRYHATYERVQKRRGNKIGRIVVARLLLRSIYKVLKDGLAFTPTIAAPGRVIPAEERKRFPKVRWIRVTSLIRPIRAWTRLPKNRSSRSQTIIGQNSTRGS